MLLPLSGVILRRTGATPKVPSNNTEKLGGHFGTRIEKKFLKDKNNNKTAYCGKKSAPISVLLDIIREKGGEVD
jgi:hypothetical protein